MTTATDFIAMAARAKGYAECSDESCPHPDTENGKNHTRFAAEAGHLNGYPWCATFVVATARAVGLRLPSESPYTPSLANGFKAAGAWSTTPQVGALAFFQFPGSSRINHVGIVAVVEADAVWTWEGNTSTADDVNGGVVMYRHRKRSLIVGYGLPAFTADVPAPAPAGGFLRLLLGGAPMAVFLSVEDEERAFIRFCYQTYLGRSPESFEAVEWWRLELHAKGGDMVMAAIYDSDEAVAYRKAAA